jgi:hypothetical protein
MTTICRNNIYSSSTIRTRPFSVKRTTRYGRTGISLIITVLTGREFWCGIGGLLFLLPFLDKKLKLHTQRVKDHVFCGYDVTQHNLQRGACGNCYNTKVVNDTDLVEKTHVKIFYEYNSHMSHEEKLPPL